MMKRAHLTVLACTAAVAAGTGLVPIQGPRAAQPGLLEERNIPLALALEAAQAAVDACSRQRWSVSATVVDRAGHVKAVVRADGAGPHTLDSSRRKAYTAASLGIGTTEAEAIARRHPAASSLRDIEGFLLLGGGLPIRADGEVVGAIGVGGAPGGEKDDMCAAAGLAKIGRRLGGNAR